MPRTKFNHNPVALERSHAIRACNSWISVCVTGAFLSAIPRRERPDRLHDQIAEKKNGKWRALSSQPWRARRALAAPRERMTVPQKVEAPHTEFWPRKENASRNSFCE